MKNIIEQIELLIEIRELEDNGLNSEEIEGYLSFFIEDWIDTDKLQGND